MGSTVRGGAWQEVGAVQGRAAQDADGIVRLGENSLLVFQTMEHCYSGFLSWKHEQRRPYLHRCRHETLR